MSSQTNSGNAKILSRAGWIVGAILVLAALAGSVKYFGLA